MIKVSGPNAVSNVSKTKGSGKTGDGGFGKMLDSIGEEKEVTATGSVGRINAVNFINSVNEDGRSKRRQLIENGDDLLDELAKIRDALLAGHLSIERLQIIQAKIDKIEAASDDSKLNDIIEEIKLRAVVELAKLGQY